MIQHSPGVENNKAANELPVNILTFHWQKGLVFQGPGTKQPDFKKIAAKYLPEYILPQWFFFLTWYLCANK